MEWGFKKKKFNGEKNKNLKAFHHGEENHKNKKICTLTNENKIHHKMGILKFFTMK